MSTISPTLSASTEAAKINPAGLAQVATAAVLFSTSRVFGAYFVAFMLLLVCSLTTPSLLAAPDFPELTGRVVDRAELLDATAEAALSAQLETHETATSNQLVVVTMPSLQGYDIADFANQLGRHWGIGQAEKDNGILLLIAPIERKVRIEVGYGLEGALTDAVSADIIQRQILPQFREGEYPTGIAQGVSSIINAIDGEYTVTPQSVSNNPAKTYFPLFFLALIALFEVLKRFGLRKLGNSAFPTALFGIAATAISNNIVVGIFVAIAVFLLVYFFAKPRSGSGGGTYLSPNDRPNDDNSGYRGSGGFGGGGGSFGGGGASGGW